MMTLPVQNYAAATAKIRAMYGKRITDDEYMQMCSAHSVAEIAKILKQHPSYENVLAAVDEKQIHRGQLESLLRRQIFLDFDRICKYVQKNDEIYLRAFLWRVEIDQIISCLRLYKSGRQSDFILTVPSYLLSVSSLPYSQMSVIKSYNELCDLLSGTQYHKFLSTFNQIAIDDMQLFESTAIAWYFRMLMNFADKMTGKVKLISRELIGSQIDIINITLIFRLKKFFNMQPERIREIL